MKTFVRCGHLFTGREDDARNGETLVFDERGTLDYVGPEKGAPQRARSDRLLDYSAYFVMPGLDRRPHPPRLRQRQERGGYRPLQSARIPHLARHVLRPEGRRRRLHRDLLAGRRRADQPVDPQCHPRRPVRRAAGHGRRPLCDDPSGSDRLVPDLDRRARDLDRQARHDQRRGGRGDPPPGQGRGRLHQDCARRHPAPRERRARRRLHPGRDRDHGPRDPSPGQEGDRPCARPRGHTLRRAQRGRSDLPRQSSRRRMHRGDAGDGQRDLPDPDPPAQHDRLHPAARSGLPEGPAREHPTRIRDRLRQLEKGARRRRADADRHRHRALP